MENLLGLKDLSKPDILRILDTAEEMKSVQKRSIKKVPALRGRTVVLLFFEPSTRTRTSFELAAKRLSADVINFSPSISSTTKGESLIDTAKTIEALGADILVVRDSHAGTPLLLSKNVNAAIINAGDGAHEHPTQALLDIFTIREKKKDINGLKVLIVGDILHSRVARSNIWGLQKLGAEVSVCGPATLIPSIFEKLNVRVYHSLDKALVDKDVINVLRIQRERQKQQYFPGLREYTTLYGLDKDKLKKAKPDAIVMHPGPMNRGIEISENVADGPQSVILEQVTNGVAVRMAVLFLLKKFKTDGMETD